MRSERISAIIPTYNRAHTLGNAIRSIEAQTVPVHEIIIVDDCSSDGTESFLKTQYPQCVYIRLPFRSGAQAARAEGVRHASGDWIAFLDSDDMWLPEKNRWQLEKAAEGYPVVHGDSLKKVNGKDIYFKFCTLEGQNVFKEMLAYPSPLYQTLLLRRECFDTAGLPDSKITSYQEWDFSLQMAKNYPLGYVNKPLMIYCLSPDGISIDIYRRIQGYEQIVCKWWEDIMSVAGAEVGMRHYRKLGQLAYRVAGLPGLLYYTRLGSRLTKQKAVGIVAAELFNLVKKRINFSK